MFNNTLRMCPIFIIPLIITVNQLRYVISLLSLFYNFLLIITYLVELFPQFRIWDVSEAIRIS